MRDAIVTKNTAEIENIRGHCRDARVPDVQSHVCMLEQDSRTGINNKTH